MSAVLHENNYQDYAQEPVPVVVVGTGPVGIHFVKELLKHNPDMPVAIYGNEPWEPYNRVRLSSLLTGELNLSGIKNPLKLERHHHVVQHHNCEIVAIDRKNKIVYDRLGNAQRYTQLVLATGSSPHIPSIEGIEKSGIYTFRSLDDAQQLIARRMRSNRAVILGGGLLGLEAARGMRKYNTNVTIIEHSTRLMFQQLDDEAGTLLREHMMSQNIQVVLNDAVKCVIGSDTITGLELKSGRKIKCDTLVIAAGIKPNIQLALNAGISVGRGIRVNDQMQTSDVDVYAIGECAEHNERVYGLVTPGLEQAGVAAYTITGRKSHYIGSEAATRLKVVGVTVLSAGRTAEQDNIPQLRGISWRSADSSCYRKLLLLRNRLVGVIGYGDWAESSRIQESVLHKRYIWPWQIRRFLRYGILWPATDASDINDWPASAIVCQCNNVNRGTLSKAMHAGHCSAEALCSHTGASSVCGSCKPLIMDLLGGQTPEPEKGSNTLVWASIVTLLAAFVMLFVPPIPFSDTAQIAVQWDQLWRDGLIKQISGFSLLGLGALVSLISLRKRIKRLSLGNYSLWRVIHVVLGLLAVTTLVAHTGLRLGSNLNLYLMLTFVGLLLAGGIASGAIGLQHILPRKVVRQTRELSLWTHILLLWPLPSLLGFHVLKTYWF